MDTLYWYYVQSKKNNDVVGKIVKLFSNNGNKLKTRISIIQQLLQQVRTDSIPMWTLTNLCLSLRILSRCWSTMIWWNLKMLNISVRCWPHPPQWPPNRVLSWRNAPTACPRMMCRWVAEGMTQWSSRLIFAVSLFLPLRSYLIWSSRRTSHIIWSGCRSFSSSVATSS